MKDFKKKALILTLAATVSVTGSFAADNYKNCLMNLEFTSSGDKAINLVLNTKSAYEHTISPIRKDAETYIIMLPEVDSKAPTPDLSETGDFIKSVEIRKMPYANGSKGYTKILIKTAGMINLNTTTALYLPSEKTPQLIDRTSQNEDDTREKNENAVRNTSQNTEKPGSTEPKSRYQNGRITSQKTEQNNEEHRNLISEPTNKSQNDALNNNDSVKTSLVEEPEIPTSSDDATYWKTMIGLLVLFISLVSVYLYIRAQDKLTNVMGENLKIDIDDEKKETKKDNTKKHRIRTAINKLDSKYSKSTPLKSYLEEAKQTPENPENELNIVDLDLLFKEKQSESSSNNKENENISGALDEFLSGFSFDDKELHEKIQTIENGAGYDEEEYERLFKNSDIKFSKDDINCFNELLKADISDDVIQNIDKYAVTDTIKHKKLSKEQILENLVAEYTIKQNITFSSKDIEALKSLIVAEIDPNFVYDLRTDHNLTEKMEESIVNTKIEHNPTEIVTLNVKDAALPNLAKELKKQGKKPIVSEAKPEVVYFSEGYDVSTLSVDIDLPNLEKELKNEHAYDSKPSYNEEKIDSNYTDSVVKLHTTGLPDLQDVMAHPDKYEDTPKEEYVVDENALLNSIMNAEFKPFDDGTRKFEIVNDLDNENTEEEPAVQMDFSDIQRELSQFNNFEVAEEENEKPYTESEHDDFETLYNQHFVDLDVNKKQNKTQPDLTNNYAGDDIQQSIESTDSNQKTNTTELQKKYKKIKNNVNEKQNSVKIKFVPQNLNKVQTKLPKRIAKEKSPQLQDMLEKIRAERKNNTKINSEAVPQKEKHTNTKSKAVKAPEIVKCILEGVNYDVVSSVAITETLGCHLAKSDKGYKVLAYHDTDLFVLKEYDSLNVERIQVRQTETLPDGTPRYLIKVGLFKFLADIKNDKIEYVMDLC